MTPERFQRARELLARALVPYLHRVCGIWVQLNVEGAGRFFAFTSPVLRDKLIDGIRARGTHRKRIVNDCRN